MPTSRAGTWTDPRAARFLSPKGPHRRLERGTPGLTLIELVVVLAILGGALLIAYPRLSSLTDLRLETEARRLSSLLRELERESSSKRLYIKARVVPSKGTISISSSNDGLEYSDESGGFELSGGVLLSSLTVQGLGKTAGEVAVVFHPASGGPPMEFLLEEGGRRASVSYNPFSGKVTVRADE
ncbi:MAG: hypothetical protein A2X99_11815 [Deltaproteobacteria bacterium GWB2_55_19]|nr:MAG: hypothetical protein A2X99_11815 [Deltaproteobacteria bacterium GWB2_55_19]